MNQDTEKINEILIDVMLLSSKIEYDEYVSLMCEDECIVKMTQLKERNLSLSLGLAKMKSFLLMKTNFRRWFDSIDTHQRQRFINFIQLNKDYLLTKNNQDNCIMA